MPSRHDRSDLTEKVPFFFSGDTKHDTEWSPEETDIMKKAAAPKLSPVEPHMTRKHLPAR